MVTGASGFLGQAVVARLLEVGWDVDAVSSGVGPTDSSDPRVRWHQIDLLDAAACDRSMAELEATHLVHLAWAPNRDIYTSAENFRWVTASARLLEGFLEAGGARVVFAGSSAEYDWSHGVCRETATPLSGGGAYGAAKRALGELFGGLCKQYSASGAWARIFFLFGPHEAERRLVPAVARALIERRPVLCSDGTQVRDYMFVDDAADAIVRLLDSAISGPVNIASGEGIRVRDLVTELAERAGSGDARIEWGAVQRSEAEAPLVVASVARLREELNWRPRIGVSAGIDRTLSWWRERLAPETVSVAAGPRVSSDALRKS